MKVTLAAVVLLLCGCNSMQRRVPVTAFNTDKPYVYLAYTDRVPKEVMIDVRAPGADVLGWEEALEEIAKVAPEFAKAYRDVERNTTERNIEIFIVGYVLQPGQLTLLVQMFMDDIKELRGNR